MYWLIHISLIGYLAGCMAFYFAKKEGRHEEKMLYGIMGSFLGSFLFRLIGLGGVSFVGELFIGFIGTYLYLIYLK